MPKRTLGWKQLDVLELISRSPQACPSIDWKYPAQIRSLMRLSLIEMKSHKKYGHYHWHITEKGRRTLEKGYIN